jgi:hypothetical protein
MEIARNERLEADAVMKPADEGETSQAKDTSSIAGTSTGSKSKTAAGTARGRPRNFDSTWQTEYPWVLFVDDQRGRGFLCKFCIDAAPPGKKDNWITSLYVEVRERELSKHERSKMHQHSVDILRQRSLRTDHLELTKRDIRLLDAWRREFMVIYWICKEEVHYFLARQYHLRCCRLRTQSLAHYSLSSR